MSEGLAFCEVAGHHGQGTLTLVEINSRRRHRRQQLRGIKTAPGAVLGAGIGSRAHASHNLNTLRDKRDHIGEH